jgi:hypothetical protein
MLSFESKGKFNAGSLTVYRNLKAYKTRKSPCRRISGMV